MALYVRRPRRDEVRIGRGLPSGLNTWFIVLLTVREYTLQKIDSQKNIFCKNLDDPRESFLELYFGKLIGFFSK